METENLNNPQLRDDELLMFSKLFEEFDKTSLGLKKQYSALQEKMDELLLELEQKNGYLDKVYKEQQDTNNLLYSILANLSSGVAVFNRKGRIIIFNRRAKEITGYSSEEASGLEYPDIFRFDNYEADEISLLTRQMNGEYEIEVEVQLFNRNDEKIPVFIKTTPLFDENEEILGYIQLFDDLTKLKLMEEDVRKNRSLSEVGQMAAGIAHEIRNPLGGISGFATMLARDLKDDPDKLELVSKIQDGVKSLNKITTDVLSFNKAVNVRLTKISIKDVIVSTLELIRADLDQSSRAYVINEDYPGSSLLVDVDIQLMQRVLINLFRNALQAVPLDKTAELAVRLRFNLLENRYAVEIKDNGCGISEAQQAKLFTPFFTTKAEGTGLGLAMVKRMIEAHKGRIELNSVEGEGALFRLILPIRIG